LLRTIVIQLPFFHYSHLKHKHVTTTLPEIYRMYSWERGVMRKKGR
jgi:hypothetical protein